MNKITVDINKLNCDGFDMLTEIKEKIEKIIFHQNLLIEEKIAYLRLLRTLEVEQNSLYEEDEDLKESKPILLAYIAEYIDALHEVLCELKRR